MTDKPRRVRSERTGKLWRSLKPHARRMRQEATSAERALWDRLRRNQVAGAHFRRQHAIGRYIVDFVCLQAHLIVEVDGSVHAHTRDDDADREAVLVARGFRVLRFNNEAVLSDIDAVVADIGRAIRVAQDESDSQAQ